MYVGDGAALSSTLLGRHLGRFATGWWRQFWKVLGHGGAKQRFVCPLVTGVAIEFGHVPQLTLAVVGENRCQWFHVVDIQITRHADAVPRGDPLRRCIFPTLESAAVVTVSAIDSQRG